MSESADPKPEGQSQSLATKGVKRKRLKARIIKKDDVEKTTENVLKSGPVAGIGKKHPAKVVKDLSEDYKRTYLDTMAEESEGPDYEGNNTSYSESTDDEDDEIAVGSEIPEEMKGFIVDKVEEESEISDASDVEYEPNELDDDDLALIAENTGARWKRDDDDDDDDDEGSKLQLRRLKKVAKQKKHYDEEYEDNWIEDEEPRTRTGLDLSDIWTTVAECFGDVDLVVQILKNERVVSVSKDPLESESEEETTEPIKKEETIWDTYADPDELAREYMTKDDELIRLEDQPERLFIRYRNRPRNTDIKDIEDEAKWLSHRLLSEFVEDLSVESIREAYKVTFKDTFPIKEINSEEETREKCEMVLSWLLNERWEIPFIMYHKRHLICPPLTETMVWRIYQLDAEWVGLKSAVDAVKENIDLIGHDKLPDDVLYYSMNFNTIDDIQDVSNHLLFYFSKILRAQLPKVTQTSQDELDLLEDKVNDEIYEENDTDNDLFGDFEVISDPKHSRTPMSDLSPSNTLEPDEIIPDHGQDANTLPTANEEMLAEMDESALQDMEYGDDAASSEEFDDFGMNEDQEEKSARGAPEMANASNEDSTMRLSKQGLKRRDAVMCLIESCEKFGLNEIWKGFIPDPLQVSTVLEKSLTRGSTDLKIQTDQARQAWKELGISGVLDSPVIIQGSEEQQIEDICAQYCRGPYTTGKRVYAALVTYHAKMLANNITIRRILREHYRSYCNITTTTTPKGEAEVDPADPSWLARRLYRFPIREILKNRQIYYEYPKFEEDRVSRLKFLEKNIKDSKLTELYLELVDLENKGAINVTIHPLYTSENVPWKDEQFHEVFGEWYERYRLISRGGKQLVNDSYREKLAQQKAILETDEAMLKEAEENDRQWRRNMLDQLAFAYCPNNISSLSIWKYVQRAILNRLINVELIPRFRREVRELLLRNAQMSVLLHSQRMLQFKLDVAPNYNDIVLSLVVDSPSDGLRVHSCLVTEYGDLRDYRTLEYLASVTINTRSAGYTNQPHFKQMMLDIEKLSAIVKLYRPNVILVGLTSVYSLDLYSRIETYLTPLLEERIEIKKIDCEVPRLRSTMSSNAAATKTADDNSKKVPPECEMALSLARWYIDPLAETLNLWRVHGDNLLLRMSLHPLQHLISQEKLQAALESTLVSTVCDVGVDINRLKKGKHLESPLQFVAGFGPRKSLGILRMLRLSTIGARSQLRLAHSYNMTDSSTEMGIGESVFLNCASFIRIHPNEALDHLDTTRIHTSESAHLAEKLCTDSLDEELNGEEAIQEIFSNPTKLDDLDLEAYASLLLEKQNMPRMLPYLLFVKDELQNPYADYRVPYGKLSDKEIFFAALQVQKNHIKVGSHVFCRLDDLFENFARAVALPFQLRAHIVDYRHFREDAIRIFKEQDQSFNNLKGETLGSRVVALDYKPIVESGRNMFRIDVALTGQQRKHLMNSFFQELRRYAIDNYLSPLVQFDVNFSKKPLLNEFTEKRKIQYRRIIRHPCYRMWPIHKTISFLRQPEIPIGECYICPMSEWDRLNLVIKTCIEPFNCATFVIFEKCQRIPGELGKELYLQKEKYNNLDQIVAQFCETLKLNLEEFYMHPKYRQSTEISKVERDLIQESAMKPNSITWAILPPNPRRKSSNEDTINNPLRFTLIVVPPGLSMISGECKSIQDPIYVDHKCFRLWTHTERSLAQLIAWWKEYGYWHRNAERKKYQEEKRRKMEQYAQ